MTKYCPRCEKDKSLEEFGSNKSNKDGKQTWCFECRKQYYNENKDKILEQQKQAYDRNPDKKIAYAQEYQIENPDVHRKASKKYHENHKQESEIYYQDNREKIILAAKLWWSELKKENPEKHKALRKAAKHRRRALEANAEGFFTAKDIQEIYKQQLGRCLYCGIELNGNYHIDHKIPLIRSGTNWPNNLCCSCPKCNKSKFTKTAEEFLLFIGV